MRESGFLLSFMHCGFFANVCVSHILCIVQKVTVKNKHQNDMTFFSLSSFSGKLSFPDTLAVTKISWRKLCYIFI